MPEAREGDLATYQTCTDPDCPNRRPGTEHAHLISVERADDKPGPDFPHGESEMTRG